ncbi:MAG: SDR family NAD(P)-dependent oxidoreductase, partial [Alphaproteobacteria bacterium]|nr:SDR family NAD(P)-dependent oxidoreductase [Alphaproteobacteria bacterium]
MQGKTVVITGATSGIGEVAAVQLAEQGARVVFVARNPFRRDALLT